MEQSESVKRERRFAENFSRDHLGEASRLVGDQKKINDSIRQVVDGMPLSPSPPVGIDKSFREVITNAAQEAYLVIVEKMMQRDKEEEMVVLEEAAEAVRETTGQRKDCSNPESMGCEGGVFRVKAVTADGFLWQPCSEYNTLPLSRSLCPVRKAGWSYAISQAGIPLRYQDVTTQSLKPEWYPEHLRTGVVLVGGYISYLEEHLRKGQGLVLNGDHKAMRTSMAVHVLMEALAKGKSGYFIASASLVDQLFLLRTSNKKDRDKLQNFEDRLKDVDLLVWDDLGLEHSEDWVETKALSIISERYNNAKTTIFTTGLDLDEVPRNSIAYHVMKVTCEANEVIGFELNAPEPEPEPDQVDHEEDAGYLAGDMAPGMEKCDHEWVISNGLGDEFCKKCYDHRYLPPESQEKKEDCVHDWELVVGLGEGPGWKFCKKCSVYRYDPVDEAQEKKEDCDHDWLSYRLRQVCGKCFTCRVIPQEKIREALRDKGLAEKLAFTDGFAEGLKPSMKRYKAIEVCELQEPTAILGPPFEQKLPPKHHWGGWHKTYNSVLRGRILRDGEKKYQRCDRCGKLRFHPEPQPEVWRQEDIEADQARLKKALEEIRDKEAPGYQCEKEEPPRGEKVRPKHDWFESPDENKEICTQCGKTRATPLSALDLCDAVGLPRVEGWIP